MNSPSELSLEQSLLTDRSIAIKLIGVGGAGSNVVDRLKMDNLDRVQMAVVNTDLQALNASPVQEKVLIGTNVTRGLGAGSDVDLGREAAEVDRTKITALVKDQDLVFIVAGMGGGTGTGAAPVLAEIAIEQGALVIAFVTMPFSFEGRRVKQAEEGLTALRRVCDAVILLPNNLLLQEAVDNESVLDAFARADAWIGQGVKALWAMLLRTGLINVDFSTLRQAFMTRGGKTLFGLGSGSGENAASKAVENLRLCPLLMTPENARKADRLIVNITGGPDLGINRVNELMQSVTNEFGPDAHVVMGATIDESMQGRVELVVIGTTDIIGRGRSTLRNPATPLRARAGSREKDPTKTSAPNASEKAAARSQEPEVSAASGPSAERLREVFSAPETVAAKSEPSPTGLPTEQDEFTFGELESRGHFENTDRNLFEGQDLDVPTYFRKGIKLVL